MDPIEGLQQATDEFARRLGAVEAGHWDDPTPCAGWSVVDLVDHLAVGNAITVHLLAGRTWDESMALADTAPHSVAERVAAFGESAAAQLAAFAEPGALERICHHIAGDVPGSTVIGFRICDLLVHSWDLARATGGDEDLPDELVVVVWEGLQPVAPFIGQVGFFGTGPSGTVADDAPLELRLLDLTGRRP